MKDCPRNKMGVVIGKQGRTIKELMETSGCHVVLHQEHRKVVISASSAEQLEVGSAMVQNLLESRPVQTQQLLCPVGRAGVVIGKQGATVREVMQQSNCVIKTSRQDVTPDGRSQVFHITSETMESIELAVTLLQQIIAGHGRR
jgi:polyribonucleotide nucleotidyltransferase